METVQSKTWALILLLGLAICYSMAEPMAINFGMRKLAFSSNQFGLDLLRTMDTSRGDVVFCPFCIGSTLAMLLLGARDHTATSLRQTLYLWGMRPPEVHRAYHDLNDHLNFNLKNAVRHRSHGIYRQFPNAETLDNDLLHYDTMYMQRDFGIKYPYQMYLQRFYNTTAHPLDFGLNGEETRHHINAVIEKETGGRIKDILPDRPPPNTNLMLISGVYFRGTLGLNMSAIRQQYQLGNQVAHDVLLESRKARVRIGQHPYLNCTGIEIPLQDGLMSLVLLIPMEKESIALLETRLSAQRLSDLMDSMEVRKIALQIPRITVKTRFSNLSDSLRKLGLHSIFQPGFANLFDISDYRWMHVTNIIHHAEINVHEGSPDVSPLQIPADTLRVKMDRPMLFFIVDSLTGLALIMGKLNNK